MKIMRSYTFYGFHVDLNSTDEYIYFACELSDRMTR